MSIVKSFYFDSSQSLDDLAASVNKTLGCNLQPYEGDPTDYFCRFFALEFSLRHNPFHYDPNHELGAYQYQIGTRVPSPDGELLAIQPEITTSVAFLLFARMGIESGSLTHETSVTARYESRDAPDGRRVWFDVIANAEFERLTDYISRCLTD